MNKYELLYIVPTQYTDDEVVEIKTKIADVVQKNGGTIISSEVLGKIKLAYPINKIRHGSYVLTYFDAEPEAIKEMDRLLSLSEELLRHTIVARPAGAENRIFEISAYVAPLSEEAKEQTREGAPARLRKTAASTLDAIAQPASLAPSATSAEESKMSMVELDKKLDEILDAEDVTKTA